MHPRVLSLQTRALLTDTSRRHARPPILYQGWLHAGRDPSGSATRGSIWQLLSGYGVRVEPRRRGTPATLARRRLQPLAAGADPGLGFLIPRGTRSRRWPPRRSRFCTTAVTPALCFLMPRALLLPPDLAEKGERELKLSSRPQRIGPGDGDGRDHRHLWPGAARAERSSRRKRAPVSAGGRRRREPR